MNGKKSEIWQITLFFLIFRKREKNWTEKKEKERRKKIVRPWPFLEKTPLYEYESL